MVQRRDNLRGAAFMTLSMAGFCLNDTLVKSLAGSLPLFEAIFLRGLFATALIGLAALRAGSLRFRPAARDRRLLGQRTVGEIGGTLAFMMALFHMPIAEATAVMQFLPLAVTLAAAAFLGERVGRGRAAAIAVGFLGVLVIIRPGLAGFNAYALWALAAIVFVTLRELSTRCLSPEAPATLVVFVTSAGMTLAAGLGAALTDWSAPTWGEVGILAAAGGFLLIGYHFGVLSMRLGEIGFTQPFRYSLILWAIVLGFVVFGERPDPWTLAGALILVGTGLFTLRRERPSGQSVGLPLSSPASGP